MNTRNILFLTIILLLSNFSWAQEEQFESYDSIVDQLSTTRSQKFINYNQDPFANVLIHAGVGMAMSMTNFKLSNKSHTGLFQGVAINLGIDLFSDRWMAEGSYVNLGKAKVDKENVKDIAELNEFDMSLVYRPQLNQFLRFRSSAGLAARYLTYFDNQANKVLKYNTPAWAFALGLEAKISKSFSFTSEIAYRSSMIAETIDDNAFGAGLRLDAHF
ncbi:MAG: outer membrane beta-barrel protein [Bdellovibrionales bacterium]|nr:outer membrane beta-barrel protein [Bdellovibrionales bacterium]